MGLTDREAYIELRARYIRLVAALRSSRDHNPATLEAIERILEPEAKIPRRPYIPLPISDNGSDARRQHIAA